MTSQPTGRHGLALRIPFPDIGRTAWAEIRESAQTSTSALALRIRAAASGTSKRHHLHRLVYVSLPVDGTILQTRLRHQRLALQTFLAFHATVASGHVSGEADPTAVSTTSLRTPAPSVAGPRRVHGADLSYAPCTSSRVDRAVAAIAVTWL